MQKDPPCNLSVVMHFLNFTCHRTFVRLQLNFVPFKALEKQVQSCNKLLVTVLREKSWQMSSCTCVQDYLPLLAWLQAQNLYCGHPIRHFFPELLNFIRTEKWPNNRKIRSIQPQWNFSKIFLNCQFRISQFRSKISI